MKDYPTLNEMGINHPEQIERYSLASTKKADSLRIIYRRKKGSLLPASKRYEFGRSSKTILADGGTQKTDIVHEISPFLQRSISELEDIISNKKTKLEHAAVIKEELHRLQQEVTSRIAYIESLVDGI